MGPRVDTLPDYLNDIDAVSEAVGCLSFRQVFGYISNLHRVVCRDAGIADKGAFVSLFYATAAQRAEALLRTIGKWEEPTP